MKRKVLKDKTAAVKGETKDALQTMFDALNHGQQKKSLLTPPSKLFLTATAWSTHKKRRLLRITAIA